MTPTPGSEAARKAGCLCPVIDNGHGRGYRGQPGVFVYEAQCPVHGTSPKRRRAILLVILEIALLLSVCAFSSCVTYHLIKPAETDDWRRLPGRTP